MAIRRNGKWFCGICNKEYPSATKADECRESHDIIYVPLTRTDLNRLIQFIWLAPHDDKSQKLLTPSLVKTLNRYLKGN